MRWIDANKQRDENGKLTSLAIALQALEDNGCDCPEYDRDPDEPGTCLVCLCEAALKEQWDKIEGLKTSSDN